MNFAKASNVEEGEEEEDEDAREAGAIVEDEPACGLRSRWVPLSAEEEGGEEGEEGEEQGAAGEAARKA